MIQLKEIFANTPEMETFVRFPFQLHTGQSKSYWVPPIVADEVESFNPATNPVFEHASGRYFLAYKNETLVGRIAVLKNSFEIEKQGIKKIRFGWFDFTNDLEVSAALLAKVVDIGKEAGLMYMEGPLGFSNMDKVGVMTEGFEHIGTMVSWYNPEYYVAHYVAHGLQIEKRYSESKFYMEDIPAHLFMKSAELIKQRYKLVPKIFSSTKELMPYVDEMFDLFNRSYANLSSFVAISERQKEFFKKKYISFINPEYIQFVFDETNKMIGFAIIMPSFSRALQKAGGKLLPFGWAHLLWAKYFSKTVNFYLIGVDPAFQNKGVTAIIFKEFYLVCQKKGIKEFIRTAELEDNQAIAAIWKDFNAKVHTRRVTFKKDF
jgi:GNAT superfamily N-acetyltransferase